MRRIAAYLFAVLAALAALPALAQETYPNRAITLVTPYPPAPLTFCTSTVSLRRERNASASRRVRKSLPPPGG